MKAIVEFGVRGARHASMTVESAKAADLLARSIGWTFGRENQKDGDFLVKRNAPRVSWTSSTHFVSVSLLDGVARGSASTVLWRKPEQGHAHNPV